MANFFKKLFGKDESAKKEFVKEEDRYYFYDDRCSFKLSKEDILFSKVENEGKKYGFMTKTMGYVTIEILLEEPTGSFGSIKAFKPSYTVNGYPYWMEIHKLININRCYINCTGFWLEVDTERNTELFLNSLRKEKLS